MSAHYDSKHGLVSRSPEFLYMQFTDLSNFTRMLPEQYKASVTADYDTLSADVKGFSIGVRVSERRPYELIRLSDNNAPFQFCISVHFDRDSSRGGDKTDFYIEFDADFNLVMSAMLGKRIREALDKIVDSLVDVSEGRMPEGMPEDFKMNV